ncbi:MAG: PD-(D/E)XK nuclease family protein [Tannerellaceae bacterium]|jgi:hypothetical protein|nr:PD-(D/E)XK nuclease family protein [Tannerellaceae bacterium]
MKPFLSQVASLFYALYGADVSRLAFVFPNRRAGLFFRKYLAEACGKPVFSPSIFTVIDLFVKLSGKRIADRIDIIFTLYNIYSVISKSDETFDEFIHWGEMLLNDFGDVDNYLVNASMLFSNVTDLRAIDSDFDFLTEKQVEAIRSFWSSFYPDNKDANKQDFIAVWQILYELYGELKATLAARGLGYEGMIAREVVENLEDSLTDSLPYTKIVFVGLNALTPAEEKLLVQLRKKGMADFYWDYPPGKVTDADNRASLFAGRYLKMFPSQYPLEDEVLPAEPYIEVIGIPSATGQARLLHDLLSGMSSDGAMTTEEDSLRTAVVLPDERLLIPVLNSIPDFIGRINVTMGYPMKGSPVALLVDYLLSMQKRVRFIDREPSFYFRDVLPVLNHRYIALAAPEVMDLVKVITQNNHVYVPSNALRVTPFLTMLFTPVSDAGSASDYLLATLMELNKMIEKRSGEGGLTSAGAVGVEVEEEFIFRFFTTINRLKEVISGSMIEMTLDTYSRLLRRLTSTLSIPFRGEPLSGLQIMGVLETRALDFDRLIILSMNEGVFPQKKAASSFVPYNLRRGFGLPTPERDDSIWAYHFYRLIHRASRISLIYDSRNTAMQTGEVSRLIHQLSYHYETPIDRKLVVYNVSSTTSRSIAIEKTPLVISRLDAFREGGGKAISASAINTWLDCPLKFYFTFIEGVREEEEVSETIESSLFGSILHKVMEEIYRPLTGKTITADILKAIGKDSLTLTHTIESAFAAIFFKTNVVRSLTGQNFLVGEMIRKYAERILEHDTRCLTPFVYIGSEIRMSATIDIGGGAPIQLKGFIDRIDRIGGSGSTGPLSGGVTRIIDYKSGAGTTDFADIESLFDSASKDRPKAVMQVFMYAWMYARLQAQLPNIQPLTISPGIYYLRSLFSDTFNSTVRLHIERGKYELVNDFGSYAKPFEDALKTCLGDIFSPHTPFIQTSTRTTCSYCIFSNICG